MQSRFAGVISGERGVTGPETAVIMIALIAVAAVVAAFTAPWTDTTSPERPKGFVSSGLVEAKSPLELHGSVFAYAGAYGATPTDTVYKVSFVVTTTATGEAIDLTPPYKANDSGMEPDFVPGAEYRSVVSYTDTSQYLPDMPWTVEFIGNHSSDYLLEPGEEAEITVWLLHRDTDVLIDAVDAVRGWSSDGNGAHGILATGGTLLAPNDRFLIEVKPDTGATLVIRRVVPAKLALVMDLD